MHRRYITLEFRICYLFCSHLLVMQRLLPLLGSIVTQCIAVKIICYTNLRMIRHQPKVDINAVIKDWGTTIFPAFEERMKMYSEAPVEEDIQPVGFKWVSSWVQTMMSASDGYFKMGGIQWSWRWWCDWRRKLSNGVSLVIHHRHELIHNHVLCHRNRSEHQTLNIHVYGHYCIMDMIKPL